MQTRALSIPVGVCRRTLVGPKADNNGHCHLYNDPIIQELVLIVQVISSMPSAFSCPNSLCDSDEVFPDYEGLCAHLTVPSTRCSQWATSFIKMMTRGSHDNNQNPDNSSDGMRPPNTYIYYYTESLTPH
jgi:hypothetical protein